MRRSARLKQWLERADPSIAAKPPIQAIVTREMLTDAMLYEVMLAKMLRTVPTLSERLQLAQGHYDTTGRLVTSALHDAAKSGNHESLRVILSLYPSESERLYAVRKQEGQGCTVLHLAATSKDIECIKTILSLSGIREITCDEYQRCVRKDCVAFRCQIRQS